MFVMMIALFACAFMTTAAVADDLREKPCKPPKVAIEVCAEKAEGDAVQFETRKGDKLDATCEYRGSRLVAIPENHKKRGKRPRSE